MERNEFITYLRETLIPDLVESGHVYTAIDFDAAIFFMELSASFVQLLSEDEVIAKYKR